jgi:hypothetical protein
MKGNIMVACRDDNDDDGKKTLPGRSIETVDGIIEAIMMMILMITNDATAATVAPAPIKEEEKTQIANEPDGVLYGKRMAGGCDGTDVFYFLFLFLVPQEEAIDR